MNLKRHSVLLALLLLTVLLTACAQPAEKPAEDDLSLQGQDNVPGTGAEDGAAAEEALWTEEEIRFPVRGENRRGGLYGPQLRGCGRRSL